MALFGRTDLPFQGGTTRRFVQWLAMVLVFMCAIAATVHSYADALLGHWNRSVTGTLTVQIPQAPGGEANRDIEKILGVLKLHPAVASAAPIPRAKVIALLEPWLGSADTIADLPLPSLIDVQLRPESSASGGNVAEAVTKAVPTALVDDHRVWLNRVTELAQGVGTVALALMLMIAGALAFTVIYATRASLTEFMRTIEVLHLVGARDGYIAGQFARRALTEGLIGGLCGLMLFAPALALVWWLTARVETGILPAVALPQLHWVVLAVLPVVAGFLSMVSAHLTVRRALRAML